MAAAAAAARNLASRSIHIKIHPTARSLPERREVLRVIERFGEVEMFKSLKYDPTSSVPNAFLLILGTEAAAKAAINASPIRYRLISDTSSSGDPSARKEGSPYEDTSSSTPNSETTTPATSATTNESIFELRISPSTFPHVASIVSSPIYRSYTPVVPRRSAIAADLATRIPESISKPGLLDWVTDSARLGSSRGFRGEEGKVEWGRGAGVGWEETKPWRLRDKEREKREAEIPWVMRGLRFRGEEQP